MFFRKDLQLNNKVYRTLLKLNNFIGFFPCNVKDNIGLLIKELEKLLAPGYASFCFRKETFSRVFGVIPFSGDRYYVCEFSDCWIENHALPIIVQDRTLEQGCPHHHVVSEDMYSYASIPVVQENKVIGVLSFSHQRKSFFTRDILEILLVMANLAAIAIHQWMLLTRLEREKNELEEANLAISQLAANLEKYVHELKNAQKQLIQSEKLAAMGRLAADIAHEINNPVGIIVSRAECMLMEGGQILPQEFIDDIRVITEQAEKIARTARSLLSFARVPMEDKSWVNVNEVIEETVSLYHKHLQKRGIVVHKQLSGTPLIWGNSNQVQQVLVNLINNAVDAMGQGGNLYLRTKYDNDNVVIEVEDEGCGIAAEHLDKIFDPFFTTKGKGLGTGLGLAVSYALVEEHGGKLEVRSEVGKGTCFVLIFGAHWDGDADGKSTHN